VGELNAIESNDATTIMTHISLQVAKIHEKYDGYIFYLLDEIQVLFQVRNSQNKLPEGLSQFFKYLVGKKQRQYFAFTGSGMALTWNIIMRVPGNGFHLGASLCIINVPPHSPKELIAHVLNKLKLNFEIWGDFSDNIAQIFYLHNNITNEVLDSVEKMKKFVRDNLEKKYYGEFLSDIVPLLDESIYEKKELYHEMVKIMRRLCLGIDTRDPEEYVLGDVFLQPYVKKFDVVESSLQIYQNEKLHTEDKNPKQFYGISPGIFSTLVSNILQANGSINQSFLKRYQDNPFSFRDIHFRVKILNIGISCEGINPLWKNKYIDENIMKDLNIIEETAKKNREKYVSISGNLGICLHITCQ